MDVSVMENRPLRLRLFEHLFVLYAIVSPVSLSATNVALGLIIIAGLKILCDGRGGNFVLQKKLLSLYFALFAWAGITALVTKGFIVKTDISNVWEYSPIFLFPLFLQVTQIRKEKVVMILLVFSSTVCLLGIIQYFIPSINYAFPRQPVPMGVPHSIHFKGFFSNVLHTAGFYSITTILSFVFILFGGGKRRKKLLLWFFFALNLFALILTMRRSYFISTSIIIIMLLYVKNWRLCAVGIILFITALILTLSFSNQVGNRIQALTDINHSSSIERIYIWKSALRMAKDHPIIGTGAGNWEKEAVERYFPMIKEEVGYKMGNYGHAHNSYLTWLSECGTVGLLLFLSFWGLVVRHLLAVKSKAHRGSFDHALIVGTLASLGNLFIAGLFEHNFGTSIILLLICFLIGLSLSNNGGREADSVSECTKINAK